MLPVLVLPAIGGACSNFIQKRRETRLPDPLATFHYAKGANSYPPLALAGAGQMIRVPWKIPPLSLFSPLPLRLLRVPRFWAFLFWASATAILLRARPECECAVVAPVVAKLIPA